METKKNKVGISQPIKWTIAAFLGAGFWVVYKKFAPVARQRVIVFPSRYRKFAQGIGSWKYYNTYDPYQLAANLRRCMTGATTDNPCKLYFDKLLYLNSNELRGLHNAWIETIDNRQSVYDWIKDEGTSTQSQETIKRLTMDAFNVSGVGERNTIKPTGQETGYQVDAIPQ